VTLLESLTPEQVESFDRDGFLVVEEGLVPPEALPLLRERFLRLFDGDYETGIKPDEVNWVPGRDPEDRTRQICNGWKADGVVAAQVLSERTGRLAAQLARYRGVRLLQDNVLWKPPGTKAIGFHQDRDRRPDGARLPPAPGRGALPRAERRPDLLALPAPWRPLARRVVLSGRLGRERLPDSVALARLAILPVPQRE
jgi:hypothetical protein